MSYYTLRMISVDLPVSEKSPEVAEIIQTETRRLRTEGWEVTVHDISTRKAGEDFSTRKSLEFTRQISYPRQALNYWDMKIFCLPVRHIGVIYSDAIAYSGGREIGPSHEIAGTSHFENGPLHWRMARGPVSQTAEVFVDGGQQWGDENKMKFSRVLFVWDEKFRNIRKLNHLVGRAWDHDEGGTNRLKREIVESINNE